MQRRGGGGSASPRGCLEDLPWGWITVLVVVMGLALSPVALVTCVALQGGPGDPNMGDDPYVAPERPALDGADVTITPATELADGSTVTVHGTDLRPDGIVEVLPCALAGDGAVERCDDAQAVRFAVPGTGELQVEVTVPRFVTGGGGRAVDCTETVARCALVAADVADRNRSGGTPLTFREGLPLVDAARLPRPTVEATIDPVVDPTRPGRAGEIVTISAPGFVPGEPVEVGVCPYETVDEEELTGCDGWRSGIFAQPDRTSVDGGVGAGPDGVAVVDLQLPLRLEPDAGGRPGRSCIDPGCVAVIAAVADPLRRAAVPIQVFP